MATNRQRFMTDCDHNRKRKIRGKNMTITNYTEDFESMVIRCKACNEIMGCIGQWRFGDD